MPVRTVVSLVLSFLLAVASLPLTTSSAFADTDAELSLEAYVTDHQGEIPTISPGDSFSYTVNLQCSANPCRDATMTATLPAPLVFDGSPAVTISPAIADATTDGQDLTVTFRDGGLPAGQLVMITVKARLPKSASADYNGDAASMTFTTKADNADTATDTASVKLDIPAKLTATATKSVSPTSTQPAIPGRQLTFTVGGGNASNVSVDAVEVADPADTGSANPFDRLALTGLTELTPPADADRVAFAYFDGTDWHSSAAGPIPSDPSDLLSGIDLATVKGLKFTFTRDGGSLPAGDPAKIVFTTATRAGAFDDLSEGDTVAVSNRVLSTVTRGSDTDTAAATTTSTFKKQSVQVDVSKTFDGSTLVAGHSTTATIEASTGVMPTHTLTIAEPAVGEPNLADQGLTFGSFVTSSSADAQVTWPSGATSASITYTYAGGTTETLTSTQPHTLPAPTDTVVGFTVTFTADGDGIDPNATAVVPFTVSAKAVSTEAGTAITNTVRATVTNAADTDSATKTASDDLTLLPQRVRTSIDKQFSRSWIWASAGSATTVELTGTVASDSTVGSEYLTLTDDDATFWDHVDLRRILPTDVPSNADLLVEYYDGTSWQQLTAPVSGPQDGWSYRLTSAQSQVVQGIRFVFTPKAGTDTLAAPFLVVPRFEVALRSTLRSDSSVSAIVGTDELTDRATSEVANSDAINSPVNDSSTDSISLKPISGGPGSADLVEKYWLDPETGEQDDNASVSALSDQTRTVAVRWGTDGLSMSSVEVVDDPNVSPITGSVYNAFDLVRIRPITTATDPSIGQDRVKEVDLYLAGSGWTDITTAACGSGSACDGGFPGYTLTPDEQQQTLAARLIFVAGSNSQTGAVATTGDAFDRQIDYDFRIRRTLRSDASTYVLGTSHSETYNSGERGVVRNNAQATGTLTTPLSEEVASIQSNDAADITIYDRPLNVSFTKTLDQTALGIPQNAADTFPLITATLKATNNTASGVPEIDIADPSDDSSPLSWYRYLNLYQIELSGLPEGISPDDVTVTLTRLSPGGQTTETKTYAQAQAMTPAELVDVVGVRVVYGDVDNLADASQPLIPSDASATVLLTYQLRATLRGDDGGDDGAMVATPDVANSARATVASPGGVGCTGDAGEICNTPTVTASRTVDIAQPSYSVTAGKTITPAVRYEDEPTSYTVSLRGQPAGTARTQTLTLTDAAPTFWNAFDFASARPVTLPAPVNQLRLSVLTGVQYDLVGGTLTATCAGGTDLEPCWQTSDWQDVDANGQVTPELPSGVTADQVRGVRFETRRVVDGVPAQWERPANPQVTVSFTTTRRSLLVYGVGGATDTPVPSTLPGMATAPGESVQGVTTDALTVTGLAAWRSQLGNAYSGNATASDTTQLLHRPNSVKVEKSPGQGDGSEAPRYDLDATIPYQIKITNTGSWAMSGLTIADQVTLVGGSSPLVEASTDPVFRFTVDGSAVNGFDAALDPATGAIAVTVPAGFVLSPNQALLITANLRFRDRLPAGTAVKNAVAVTSGRDFERCDFTEDGADATPITTLTPSCSSSTTVVAAASTPISVAKAVKGTGAGDPAAAEGAPNHDDLGVIAVGDTAATACATTGDGFYTYPCTPITRPGGTETWRLTLANNGNVAANTISAIDVLPAPGDTGVIVSTARKSRFTPTFLGNMTVAGLDGAADHALTYFYSTTAPTPACNKADIVNDTKPGGQSNCGTNWIPFTNSTSAAELATARAIKVLLSFTSPSAGLNPGVPFTVTFDTSTPAYSPTADPTTVEPVAWNSVAVGSRTANSETFPARASLVTEPRKVGVAIATGELSLTKTVAAPTADWTQYLPSSYAASLTCESLGRDVPLHNSSGGDVSGVQLAADGTPVAYNATHLANLPLFSTCSLSETAGQGATASYQPASTTALRDYSGVANIAHGWGAGSTTASLNVTNTYANAGFTVTKTVPAWPATYADGSPVVFRDFTYSASCSFLGHEVLPAGDQTFSLRDGGSKAFTDLPAGAQCTVQETYAAGADTTTVTTTQGGTTVDTGAAATAFTLVAGGSDATAVAYTNTFSAGSAVITKSITGPGATAWGDQSFDVQLVCTHPDANPTEVYRATKTLSRATTLSWTVDHLANGAQCSLTETASGGATGVTITGGTFTVDAHTPAQVGVTNRFGTGSVTVTKQVRANGAATTASPWADGSYPVTLSCTRTVNGSPLAVDVPGGPTKSLTRAGSWTATWSGLPTNATCSVAEDVASITGVPGQPDPTVTVAPTSLVVGDGTTASATVTNDYRAGKLKITKTLVGAGASFFTGATFQASCTLGGATVVTRTGISVPAGTLTSAEIGPIPFGASCTVTETNAGGADQLADPQTVTVNENPATSDVTTVNVQNAFSAGTVTVTKVLAGDAQGESWATGATFVIAVSCGTTSTASFTQNVTIVGAGSTTLMNGASPRLFPVGTHCWASEPTTGGATKSLVTQHDFSTGSVVTVQADPTVAQPLGITATNTYDYAGLTVSKTVAGTTVAQDANGNSLSYPTSVTFTASCTFNNSTTTSTPLNQTFAITGSGDGTWGSKTFTGLPSGASCTVTETTPPMSPTVTYTVTRTGQSTTSGAATSTVVPLVSGGAVDNVAAFTNTYTVGKLQLTKKVSPTGSVWASAPFTVSVDCTVSYPLAGSSVYTKSYTFSTTSASYSIALIDNLPRGASCRTTESNAGGANTTTYTNQTVTIATNTTSSTTVTNTFNTGSVKVTKALKVNGVATTAEPWASAGYSMTLSCTRSVNGSTEAVDLTKLSASATQVLNKANNFTYTWSGLPQGANCTTTESAINYPVGTPSQPNPTVTYSPTQATGVTVGNGTTVSQTVTNDFAFGSVQIVKSLAGDAATAWGTGTFTYSVSCTLTGTTGAVFSQSGITLSRATSLTSAAIGPIPKGAICTVTETGTAGATSVTPASGTVVLDAIEAGGTQTAAFTNTFDYAGFTVAKTVDNGGAKNQSGADVVYAATYHFSATCTHNGATVLSVTDFTLTDGQSRAFDSLPVGASCRVTETNTGNASPASTIAQNGSAVGGSTSGATSAAFTLVAGQPPLTAISPQASVVLFTDTYSVGGLDITKRLAGSGAAAWGAGPFTVRLVCTLDHDANPATPEITVFDDVRSLTKDQTWSPRNLPTSAHCTVTEPQTAGANQTTISLPSPTISASVQAVTVTNTFNVGSVQVTKAIAGGLGTLAPWKDTTYEFTLSCTRDFDGDGTAEAIAVPNPVKTVTGPGSVTWAGLPQSANCAAAETDVRYPAGTPAQPNATVSSSGSVTVGNGTTVGQTLTNTFSTAKVNIAKTIDGTGATTWGVGPFVFSVQCTLTGSGTVFGPTTVTLTPTAGQTSLTSAEYGPIPQGSDCVVTETDAAGASPVVPSGKQVTLSGVSAGATATASFTNTFDLAGFTVSKAVTSAAEDAEGNPIAYDAAAFTATCTFRGAEVLTNAADRAFTLAAGQSRTFTGLPTGANCTVTETGTSGAASTAVAITQGTTTTSGTTAAQFTLVPGGADATGVAFTNHYTVGSLTVTKTVAGAGADAWGGSSFGVRVVCTLTEANPNQVFDQTTTVSKASPTWTIDNLPTGARCQVSEPKDGGANGTAITNGSPVIGTNTTAEAGITNTFTLGAVSVAKALTVNGSPTTDAPWTQGSYTVKLSCTRDFDNDGVAEAITIPGGPSRTITGAGTATFTGLPTSATCSVAETDSSPVAQATTISPSGTLTVGDDPASPVRFTVSNDFGTTTMSVLKQLEGAGQASFGNGPFTFSINCSLAGASDPVYTHTVTVSRNAGSPATTLRQDGLGPVPLGAVCTVTETDRGGADATPTPVTLTIVADPATNVATFTNQFSAGTIRLAKTLDGAAKAESWATEATFTVRVTCQVEVGGVRGTVFSAGVAITGGQDLAVVDSDGNPSRVPLGSHCWADEIDRQGGTAIIEHSDWESALVVTSGTPQQLQTLDLGVVNDYEYAGFTVTKSVDGGGAVDAGGTPIAYPAAFGYHAQCSFNGETVLDQDFTLVDGGSRSFGSLPDGGACQVTETATGNAASTSIQVSQNGAPVETGGLAQFTLVRGTSGDPADPDVTTAAFTNHFTTGGLTVTKHISGAGADAWGQSAFTVSLVCSLDTDANPATPDAEVYRATRDLSAATGLVWAVTNLPTGASCAVSETAVGGANSTTITDPIPAIGNDPDDPVLVSVTNTFTTGSVDVSKRVLIDGEAAPEAAPYAEAAFQVKLTCTRNVNGADVAIDIPNDGYPVGDPLDGVRTIIGSGSYRYQDLPTGASCQVSEVGAGFPLPAAQVSIVQPDPVAASPAVVEAEVSNDYHTGTLQVLKALVGDGVPAWSSADFRFDVTCALTDTFGVDHTVFTRTGVVLNQADGLASPVYDGIPVGARCAVTETAAGGADVPSTGAEVTIADGANTVATLTNEFNLGSLKVTLGLTLDGVPTTADPFAGGRYAVQVTCTRIVNGEQVPVTVPGGGAWTFASADDREHLFDGLPVGASCSVRQTSASLTPQDVTYTPADAEPSGPGSRHVAIGADPTSPAEVGVIDHFLTSTLVVTKQVTGDLGNAVYPFTFRVDCTLAEDGVAVPHDVFSIGFQLSVADGLVSAPLGPIPVGSDCVVTETGSGGATIGAEPAELTISAEGGNAVTLTNAFGTGSVVVTKAITVDGTPAPGTEPYASAAYTVTLSCTAVVDGTSQDVTVPGGPSRTITGAGSVTFTGLPLGATCRAAETGSTLALPSDQVSVAPDTVTVGAEPAEITITNDFRTGQLVLNWSISGVGVGFAGPATFSVDCTLDGATGWTFHQQVTLQPDRTAPASTTFSPIPIGARCSVTQTGAEGADHLATVVVANGTVNLEADVANTYSAGTLTITKRLSGSGASEHAKTSFGFTVTCQAADGTTSYSGQTRIVGAGSVTIDDGNGQPLLFPAGTRCWAQETDTGGAAAHTVDHDSAATAVSVAADQPEAIQELSITAVNTFSADPGELAYTGFAGLGLAAFGGALVGLGAFLIRRRRA